MLTKRSYAVDEPANCPGCQAKVGQVAYTYRRDEFRTEIFRCAECCLMFARPVFIEALTERQMDGVENAEMFGSPLLKSIYVNWFLRRELKEVRDKISKDHPKLLDIGCGTGWTSAFWADQGFLVHGLEPSKVRAQIARDKYGLEVYSDYVENFAPDCQYDVILLRHSLEHFEEPFDVLTKINSLLAEGGVILLVVPNIDCLGRYLFGTDWSWILPWHCNFFNPRSIRSILQSAGFADMTLYQSPSPLYFFDSLGRKFRTKFFAELKQKCRVPLLLASAPFALLGSLLGMGDNITVVARKAHSVAER